MEKNIAFAGLNGFVWWVGVVESRQDPLKLCRCQVRIFAWHDAHKSLISTENLPWAQPLLPSNASNESKTPLEGDWVVGFFFDGPAGQFPVIMGVLPAIPFLGLNSGNPALGFQDARSDVQLANSPIPFGETSAQLYPIRQGEPSTSRLYRHDTQPEYAKTQISQRNSNLTTGIQIAGGGSWSEPKSAYAAVHPYNDVKETESGHILEFDDTPKAERIDIAHKTGTYFEMRPDGSKVTKVLGDNYEVTLGNNWIYVKGTCNITIGGDANIQVGGNINGNAGGNINFTAGGDATFTATGTATANFQGNVVANINGNIQLTANGIMNATAPTFNFNGPINQTNGNFTTSGDILAGSIELL